MEFHRAQAGDHKSNTFPSVDRSFMHLFRKELIGFGPGSRVDVPAFKQSFFLSEPSSPFF